MKNEQNVPQVRFKGFTDAWEQRELGEICEYHSSSLTAKDIDEDGNSDLYDANSLIGKTKKGHMETDYITIIKDGAGVGRTRLLPKKSMFLGTMGALTPRNSDLYFLYQLITNADLGKTYTGSTIPHIYFKDYGKNRYCIPSCAEQQQIGTYFRNLDHLITLHQRKCETLQKLKKSMLQKMFPKNGSLYPEIRFAGFTDAWEQRKLGEIANRITRKNTNLESSLPLTISAQYGLIDQNEFFDKRIASKDVSGYFLLKNGEFAYNKSYSNDAPWGAVKRLDRYKNGVLSTLYIVFELSDKSKTDSDFIVSYYDTDRWYKEVQAIAAEGARNHGLLNISPNDFFETVLTIPKSIEEQKSIGNYFKSLDHLITLHQRKLETLKKMKKSMLQKMFI